MGRAKQNIHRFRIGTINVDPRGNTISNDKREVSLEPQVMDVLCVLAAHPGEVVLRDTLIEQAWTVSHVSNESVTRVISLLRRSFRELGESIEYVETVQKRGYRLLVDVEHEEAVAVKIASDIESLDAIIIESPQPLNIPNPAEPKHRKRYYGPIFVTLIAMFFLAVVYQASNWSSRATTPPMRSVAVLPFVSMSIDREDELFAEGLSEELLNSLSNIDDLKVAARRSSFAYKGHASNVKDIGKALDVSYVLEGSIRRSGKRMRITSQLVSVEDGFYLWSHSYDRELDDIFVVQDDIARQVARALDAQLTGVDVLFDAGTDSEAAFKHYLEARQYLNRRGLGLSLAIASFEAALEADPDYGRAYAGLATSHVVSHIYLDVPKDIARKRASDYALKALETDPRLSEPYAVLGVIEADQNNWDAAIYYYERGESQDPNDVTVLQWYAEALTYLGYLKKAEEKILRASELEPDSAILALVAGIVYHNMDDLDRTEEYYRRAETLGLSNGVNGFVFVELARGNIERAANMMATASFHDKYISENEVDALEVFFLDIMRHKRLVDGPIQAFPVLAADDDFMTPAYMISGESELALKSIEVDSDGDHDSFYLLWTNLDPNLRKHPYFQTFIRNTGLLDFWLKEGWPDKCKAIKRSEPIMLKCQ